MKRFILFTLLVAAIAGIALAGSASAWEPGRFRATPAPANCWHGPYYHTGWGMPVALIVPPTAERQTHWGWGIGNTRITPIGAQYSLGHPVSGSFGPAAIYPTPSWPSDLDQFGVYYIRGPW